MFLSLLPNLLSCLRIVLTIPVVYLLFCGTVLTLLFAVILFTVAALTDFWDGALARRFGVSSQLGAFIDPLADKFFVLGVMAAFAYLGILPLILFWIFLIRDVLLTVMRTVLLSYQMPWHTSKIAKWKTFLQFLILYGAFFIAWINMQNSLVFAESARKVFLFLVWPIALLTAYTACDYVWRYYKPLERIIKSLKIPLWQDKCFLFFATLGFYWVPVVAPGTVASALAASSFYFLPSVFYNPLIIVFLFILGWFAATRAVLFCGEEDPRVVVIDEVVAVGFLFFLIDLLHIPRTILILGMAFGLFRFFDIVKPFPIRKFEKIIGGGLGIMIDDMVAALFAAAVLKIFYHVF